MASQHQHQLSRILDLSGPGTYNEVTGKWTPGCSGWSLDLGLESNTPENAEKHLLKWAAASLKKDEKAVQKEQEWFNDTNWTLVELKGPRPFYTRMALESYKLKKKIGMTITDGAVKLDPVSNI